MSQTVYVYDGAIYCEDCGNSMGILESEQFPDGGGEADSPQHCDRGKDCLNAYECGGHVSNPHMVGMFLENPLTNDGYAYVRERYHKHVNVKQPGDRGCVIAEWAEFYDIKSDE